MFERKETFSLKRFAYVDESKEIPGDYPSVAEINNSKSPLLSPSSSEQRARNEIRDKLNKVIMVEFEVDEKNDKTKKHIVVVGVGVNLSENGLKNKVNKDHYCPDDKLNPEAISRALTRIYYNMMSAASAHEAIGLVVPLLSTGYYAGKYGKEMNEISKNSFNEAIEKFRIQHPASTLKDVLIARNSIEDAARLADKLECLPHEIAVGIAGADNSGTGSLFTDETKNKIAQIENGEHVRLPQEEYVRYKMGGAFNSQKCYFNNPITVICEKQLIENCPNQAQEKNSFYFNV